jgi:hypothetical protein
MSVHLEPAAREFAEATALPPYLFDLGPARGRAVVDEAQSGPVPRAAAEITHISVNGGPAGAVPVRIVRPLHTRETHIHLLSHAPRTSHETRTGGTRHRLRLAKAEVRC